VAVQSHYFCVGGIVAWAEAGVGAVATQSFVEVTYGPLGLALMRAGKSASQALHSLLVGDPQREGRQVGMVDTRGNVATHTGSQAIQAAGHRQGKHYSAQANLMLKDTVWNAMGEAYEGSKGDLAERLLAALDAAEAEGGDIRGKQSAALLVVGGERTGNAWAGRLFDLRVDDHPQPLPELRRLVRLARAYRLEDELEAALMTPSTPKEEVDRLVQAGREGGEALLRIEGNPELLYWQAVALVTAHRMDEALPIFQRVFAVDSAWRDLVPRMVDGGLLPRDEATIKRIIEV
jgi:uncharacterized Ntn-hydrolase superfamily protein